MNCELGIAKGCRAECCGIFPMEKEWFESHRDRVVVKFESFIWDSMHVVKATEDLLCVFLHRETRQCVIYDERPGVCRRYGEIGDMPCPYVTADGKLRSRAERRRILRAIPWKTKLGKLRA